MTTDKEKSIRNVRGRSAKRHTPRRAAAQRKRVKRYFGNPRLDRIERSGFRKGQFVGYANGVWHIRKDPSGWYTAIKQDGSGAVLTAKTLTALDKKFAGVEGVKKNPRGHFVICAHLSGHSVRYYRHSTGGFIESTDKATHYKSRPLAERTAKSILNRLPGAIKSLSVKPV